MKYAILTEHSVTIPGDERSRTNPGHGYPEYTETYTKMETFETEAAMLERIKRYQNGYTRQRFKAIEFNELEYEIKLKRK